MLKRINAVLLVLVVTMALAVVTLQHQTRRTYSELEKEQRKRELLDVEYRKLLVEQSTWGAHGIVEQAAKGKLQMHTPDPHKIYALVSKEIEEDRE